MPRPRRSEDMIVEIARLRYEQRLPQTEIARLLDISEATVSRALKSALDLGYIEFQVTPKAFRDSASEQRLKAHLGLRLAVVVESKAGAHADTLGKAVARVIEDTLKSGDVLGVSDGATAAAIAAAILHLQAADLGLGSCWVQIRRREHDATTSAQDYVAGLLGLPPGMMVLAIIGIGHPVETKAGHPRGALPFAQVSRERFGRRD